MLTLEARINGQLIGYVDIHNTGQLDARGNYLYMVKVNRNEVGAVIHDRKDGWFVLAELALRAINGEEG